MLCRGGEKQHRIVGECVCVMSFMSFGFVPLNQTESNEFMVKCKPDRRGGDRGMKNMGSVKEKTDK